MSKYYFHVRRADVVYMDREGCDLLNADDAVAHAVEDARDILRREPKLLANGQWIEIADDRGNVIRTVPFEMVLPPT